MPGTVWLKPETLAKVLRDMVLSLYEQAIGHVAVVDGHGGNFVLDAEIRELNANFPDLMVIKAVSWDRNAGGARRSDILWQFLVEAIVLSVTGGLAGIGLGWALSALVNTLDAFVTHVSPQAVALGVGFSLAVGVFFGIYPASRASNLNPIDALRYE